MFAFSLIILLFGCDKNRDIDTAEIAFGDLDGDGWSVADGDCNDERPDMRPEGSEICDGLDNDCDGLVDEATANTWYVDGDGDGYGTGEGVATCTQPGNYVPQAGDCDDEDPSVHPGASEECDGIDDDCDGEVDDGVTSTFFTDADADGYGDPSAPVQGCEAPEGSVDNDFDCDDEDPAVNPVAPDVCNDVDDDCDGELDEDPDIGWYQDKDGDGYGGGEPTVLSCEEQEGLTDVGGDSDDYDNSISPGADELCDGIDNDSDGEIDEEDSVDASVWYADQDNDGYGDEQNPLRACSQPDGYVAIGGDTDDASNKVNPGADELCDGVDNDSDGVVDEDDALDAELWTVDDDGDGYGDASGSGVYACNQPSGYAQGSDCDDGDASVHPGATETCDGVDQDCDGTVDDNPTNGSTFYRDWDGDGYGNVSVTIQACSVPSGYSADKTDCDDTVASTHPGADEYCDGDDDDCNGTVDDNPVDSQDWYYDADADGYGADNQTTTACTQPSGYSGDGGDCDDGNANVNPGASEVCDNIDNDCDGVADESDASNAPTWYRDLDKDGFGNANKTTDACSQPSGYVADSTDCDDTDASARPGGTEVCDGVDNDCDGNADWGLSVGVDYSTIQDAIDASTNGDEICVPAGTYTETIDFLGKRIVLEGEGPGLSIIDGDGSGPVVTFASGETSVTSLSGFTITGGSALDGAGVYVDGASPTLEDLLIEANSCNGSSTNNCRGVGVFVYDGDVSLTDVVIQDNTASTQKTCTGVGLYVLDGSATVDAALITDNDASCVDIAGLGVRAATDATLVITDSTISEHTAAVNYFYGDVDFYGLGLDTYGSASVELSGVVVEDNTATVSSYWAANYYGAGISLRGASAVLDDVVVQGNGYSVQGSNGGTVLFGGGLYAADFTNSVELTDVWLLDNSLTVRGNGSAYGGGGGFYEIDPQVDGLVSWGNDVLDSTSTTVSLLGGGLALWDSGGTWDHVWLADNLVKGHRAYAGGLYALGSYTVPEFTNLIVSNNKLQGEVGTSTGYGAGLMTNNYALPVITNADIVENSCSVGGCQGGGVQVWNWGGIDLQNTNIVGNVAAEGGGAVDVYDTSKVYFTDFDYCNAYDNGTSAFDDLTDPTGSDGNIGVDPAYADITSSADSLDWDLSLSTGSSCIDAGDPSILDTDNSTSDIGAYGGPGGAW